ncbi:hydrolase [Oceanobacter mangrovi]|uniref:hydrolase n=1 Tax=Oceanobacter mangrovi TaxID=2862510 RepID=UPI001C8D1074|nr:hydrolase [Oceanobacter mangrovi]
MTQPNTNSLQNTVAHQQLLDYLASRADTMLQATRSLCEINSGSYNLDGIEQVQQQLQQLFAPLADSHRLQPLGPLERVTDSGDVEALPLAPMQIFQSRPAAPLQLLFTGHCDTVFPLSCDFQHCHIDGNRLHGPGTADMKGGLVLIAEVIRWLNQSGIREQVGFTVAISPDEEIGSPCSGPILMQLAKQALANASAIGMTYEPALEDGTLAGARKGSGNFAITAKGRSSHAGRAFFEGRNAVAAIAKVASQLANLSDEDSGLSLNIGQILGGGAVNIVPDSCICRFNVRVAEPQQQQQVLEDIHRVIDAVSQDTGVELALHGHFNRPPKPMTAAQQRLFEILREGGAELGLDIRWRATGGCCEGNNLAAAGLINIDTLGVRGANIHTDQEYACSDSFVERAALSIVLIQKLLKLQQEGQLPC